MAAERQLEAERRAARKQRFLEHLQSAKPELLADARRDDEAAMLAEADDGLEDGEVFACCCCCCCCVWMLNAHCRLKWMMTILRCFFLCEWGIVVVIIFYKQAEIALLLHRRAQATNVVDSVDVIQVEQVPAKPVVVEEIEEEEEELMCSSDMFVLTQSSVE
jgi:hypothetical protein